MRLIEWVTYSYGSTESFVVLSRSRLQSSIGRCDRAIRGESGEPDYK
jgi:hypothetical protein